MDKLIDSMSFSEDWKVTLLSEGPGLEKCAAAHEVTEYVQTMEKKKDKFYLHINAMGAGEYYGSNRNGDYFPEDNLRQWHKTFETSPAHVFRHHVNKNPAIAIGKVLYSYYNERMHRVELIAEVDREMGAAELREIELGRFPMTSMACNTPYDVCSICNNRAHNRAEYCSHLNTQLNKTLPDGRRVMSLNVGPLKFFDISVVIRPADITSSVLQKVASNEDMPAVSSAEAAELEGISHGTEKQASIRKMAVEKTADLLKEIPCEVLDSKDTLQSILKNVMDPEDSLLDHLKHYNMSSIITTFAALSINPSLRFLIKIIAGKEVGHREDEIAGAAINELNTKGVEAIPKGSDRLLPDIVNTEPDPYLLKVMAQYIDSSSYDRSAIEKRASHSGYANWQVGRGTIEPSAFFHRDTASSNSLLTLAGAAIIAKIMISTIVGMSANTSTGVEKSAELTVKLMDASVRSELKGMGNV